MNHKKICVQCGGSFVAKRSGTQYCSQTCRRNHERQLTKAAPNCKYNGRVSEEEKRKDKPASGLIEKQQLAREAGLSYGKWQAKKFLEEQQRVRIEGQSSGQDGRGVPEEGVSGTV